MNISEFFSILLVQMKSPIHNQNESIRRGTSLMTTMTSRRLLVTVSVFIILLTVQTADTVPIYIRSGRHGNGNGGSAGSSALQRGTRPPRPGNGSSPHYEIERPHECRNDTIFADCFLCGKIADDIRIYRACCQRDVEIISFCHRLLD